MSVALSQLPKQTSYTGKTPGAEVKSKASLGSPRVKTAANDDRYTPGGSEAGPPKLQDMLKLVNPSVTKDGDVEVSGKLSRGGNSDTGLSTTVSSNGDRKVTAQASNGTNSFSAGYEKADGMETFTAEAKRKGGERTSGVRFRQDEIAKVVQLYTETENGQFGLEHSSGEGGDVSTFRTKRRTRIGSVGGSVSRDQDSTKYGVNFERTRGSKTVAAEVSHDSRDGMGVGVTFKMTV